MNTGLLTVSGSGSGVLDSLSVTCRLVRILGSIGGSGEGNSNGGRCGSLVGRALNRDDTVDAAVECGSCKRNCSHRFPVC